eukprot:124433_1
MPRRGRKRWVDEEQDEDEDSVNGERFCDGVQASANTRVKFDEELGESEEKTKRSHTSKPQRTKGLSREEDDDAEDEDTTRMVEDVGEEEGRADKFDVEGEIIEPFNLRSERDDGYFDKGGNFVWRKEFYEPDAWVAGLSEADVEESIGLTAEAHARKCEAEAKEADSPLVELTSQQLLSNVLQLLQPKENILGALRRLGKARASDHGTFDQLTEIADQLLQRGEVNIYEQTCEELQNNVSRTRSVAFTVNSNNHTTSSDITATSGVKFQYRGRDGQIHGPYPLDQMQQWATAGYFSGDNVVMMRAVRMPEVQTESAQKVEDASGLMADLEDDDEDDSDKRTDVQTSGSQETKNNAGTTTGQQQQIRDEWFPSDSVDFSKFEIKK